MKTGCEAIILFKPDAKEINIHGKDKEYLLHEIGAKILRSMGLQIVNHNEVILSEEDVYRIYQKVLRPNPEDDAIWGTAWKKEVINHMTSGPVDAYLVTCDKGFATQNAKALKRHFRSIYSTPDNVVQNVAHVPDDDEFEVAKEILFKDE